jgi:hypothetical protein
MRNILLDDDGMVWVFDWGWAGFYPAWFEYLGMRFAAQKDNETLGWQLATKLIAEPSPKWRDGWQQLVMFIHNLFSALPIIGISHPRLMKAATPLIPSYFLIPTKNDVSFIHPY